MLLCLISYPQLSRLRILMRRYSTTHSYPTKTLFWLFCSLHKVTYAQFKLISERLAFFSSINRLSSIRQLDKASVDRLFQSCGLEMDDDERRAGDCCAHRRRIRRRCGACKRKRNCAFSDSISNRENFLRFLFDLIPNF